MYFNSLFVNLKSFTFSINTNIFSKTWSDHSQNALSMYLCLMQVESAIRTLLDAYFPQLSGVQVLAQPGSFYVASAFSLAVNIIGKKIKTQSWNCLSQGASFCQ